MKSIALIFVVCALGQVIHVQGNFLANMAIDGMVTSLKHSLDPLKIADASNDLNLTLLMNVQLASLKLVNTTIHGLKRMKRINDGDVFSTDSGYAAKISLSVRKVVLTTTIVPSIGNFFRVEYPIPGRINIDNMTMDFNLKVEGFDAKPSVDKVTIRHFKNVKTHFKFGFFLHYLTDPVTNVMVKYFNGAFRMVLAKILEEKINESLASYQLNPFG